DTNVLDARFTGRDYDTDLLNDLPAGVDPCGENGEFHTFVYDGPIFKEPLGFERGEVVLREKRFSFCDLLSATVVETKA
ncbi:MAG TPA: ATP-binding protein, partial [Actinobacteria bacterium]|nr:ATP-binding protein [Actinomycetota bacterium]